MSRFTTPAILEMLVHYRWRVYAPFSLICIEKGLCMCRGLFLWPVHAPLIGIRADRTSTKRLVNWRTFDSAGIE